MRSRERLPFPNLSPEQAYALALDSVYFNMTVRDLEERLGCEKSDVRYALSRYNIPVRNAGTRKLFDPSWLPMLEVAGYSENLGALCKNPCDFGGVPLSELSSDYSRLAPGKLIPVSLMAVAQYKVGFLPTITNSCVRFRDGNPENLRPENLVYTGVDRVSSSSAQKAAFNELPLLPFLAKCPRCGFRSSESQTPSGWKKMQFLEYSTPRRSIQETRMGEGLLCPICQEFTDVLWNGSRG